MKNLLLHLRLPFSFFLMPIFWFALSQVHIFDISRAIWIFIILHLLVFPASNAYNSYHDKDEGSIGLLKNPPPVSKKLYYLATSLDVLSVVLGICFVNVVFAGYLLLYISISRAYSVPSIRLKKHPILSWLIVSLFQGALTYIGIYIGITQEKSLPNSQWLPALICTSNLLAIYPLTQVYQHREDAKRGDMTMSRLLGIKGTFLNACLWLALSGIGFLVYFGWSWQIAVLSILLSPLILFFGWWLYRVWQDQSQANFQNTMRLNAIASVCLNLFFGILCYFRFS